MILALIGCARDRVRYPAAGSPHKSRYQIWKKKYPNITIPNATAAFLGTGLLAYVIIPGLLVMWDRVLDYMAGY